MSVVLTLLTLLVILLYALSTTVVAWHSEFRDFWNMSSVTCTMVFLSAMIPVVNTVLAVLAIRDAEFRKHIKAYFDKLKGNNPIKEFANLYKTSKTK